jgi:hypothetical protein
MNCPTIIALLAALVFASTTPASAQTPQNLIQQAGNANSEKERYQLLVKLSERTDLAPQLRTDLDLVLPLVDKWANGREKYWSPEEKQRAAENGYLNDHVNKTLRALRDGNKEPIAQTSPLFPIWAMYTGRMLIQLPIQSGGIYNDPEKRTTITFTLPKGTLCHLNIQPQK